MVGLGVGVGLGVSGLGFRLSATVVAAESQDLGAPIARYMPRSARYMPRGARYMGLG